MVAGRLAHMLDQWVGHCCFSACLRAAAAGEDWRRTSRRGAPKHCVLMHSAHYGDLPNSAEQVADGRKVHHAMCTVHDLQRQVWLLAGCSSWWRTGRTRRQGRRARSTSSARTGSAWTCASSRRTPTATWSWATRCARGGVSVGFLLGVLQGFGLGPGTSAARCMRGQGILLRVSARNRSCASGGFYCSVCKPELAHCDIHAGCLPGGCPSRASMP